MKLREIVELIEGQVLFEPCDLEREVQGGCGADLMSDVLAYSLANAVLLTGLCNPQVVRTAHMADVAAVVFVRGKCPPQDMIDLARQEQIPLISSQYGMFELCGRLHRSGLTSREIPVPPHTNA
jgi:predicted transcriptional regulator